MTRMADARSPRRPPSGAPGTKMLITVGALAATLGGWSVLGLKPARVAEVASPPASVIATPAQSPPDAMLSLPPLPTLVPAPASLASNRPVVQVPASGSTMGQPAGVQPAPALRVVSAPPAVAPPPAPVAITRSSQ